MTTIARKSVFKLTKDTLYIALTGELWGVYHGKFEENWPYYNGIALYYCLIGGNNLSYIYIYILYLDSIGLDVIDKSVWSSFPISYRGHNILDDAILAAAGSVDDSIHTLIHLSNRKTFIRGKSNLFHLCKYCSFSKDFPGPPFTNTV